MAKNKHTEIEKLNVRSGGGLGKQIVFTAVMKALRSQKPDAVIHLMTSYPEAFTNIDSVDRVYPLSIVPHFYEDHKDYQVLECEPYTDLDFRQGKLHLIESWCKMFGIQAPSTLAGIIELSEEEKKVAEQIWLQWKVDRPVIAFQPFGGTSYYTPQEANNPTRPQHYRELTEERAQQIVDMFVELGFAVLHIGLPTEPQLKNCLHLSDKETMNPRYIFSIMNKCKFGVFIDSFAQHAWVALGKSDAVVLWGGTNPDALGYKVNKNLSQPDLCTNIHCNRPNTFMFDFGGNSQPWRCVVGGKCMKFEPKHVVKEFLLLNAVDKIADFEKKYEKK